jgi:hypothetical protein
MAPTKNKAPEFFFGGLILVAVFFQALGCGSGLKPPS